MDLIRRAVSYEDSDLPQKRDLQVARPNGFQFGAVGDNTINLIVSDGLFRRLSAEIAQAGSFFTRRILRLSLVNGKEQLTLHIPNKDLHVVVSETSTNSFFNSQRNEIVCAWQSNLANLLSLFHEAGHAFLQDEYHCLAQQKLNVLQTFERSDISRTLAKAYPSIDLHSYFLNHPDNTATKDTIDYWLEEFSADDQTIILDNESRNWEYALKIIEDVLDFYEITGEVRTFIIAELETYAILSLRSYINETNNFVGKTLLGIVLESK